MKKTELFCPGNKLPKLQHNLANLSHAGDGGRRKNGE